MTTPTPPADAPTPTPRTDAVNECAKRLILNRPFGSSTADLLQELADLYSKHAESLERFLGSALANNDPLREKVIEFQRELAAKDARIAALEQTNAALKAELLDYREAASLIRADGTKIPRTSISLHQIRKTEEAFADLRDSLTAARALNDTLAQELKEYETRLSPTLTQEAKAALSAYAKSKEAQP